VQLCSLLKTVAEARRVDSCRHTLNAVGNGWAKVNSKRRSIEIGSRVRRPAKAHDFRQRKSDLTCCGRFHQKRRAQNLGEVLVGGNERSKLHVTTDLQAFAHRLPRSLISGPAAEPTQSFSRTSFAKIPREPARQVNAKYETDGARRIPVPRATNSIRWF